MRKCFNMIHRAATATRANGDMHKIGPNAGRAAVISDDGEVIFYWRGRPLASDYASARKCAHWRQEMGAIKDFGTMPRLFSRHCDAIFCQ